MAILEQSPQFIPKDAAVGPDSGAGNPIRADLPQEENPAAETNQNVSLLQPHAQGLLGLPYTGQEPASEDAFETIQAERRTRWEGTGEVPSIAGGSPRRRVKSPHETAHETENRRLTEAQELGLPEYATWDEIFEERDRNKRKAIAKALDPKGDFAVAEKLEEEGLTGYPTWQNLLVQALHLHGVPGNKLDPEEVAKRIKTARKFFRAEDKKK